MSGIVGIFQRDGAPVQLSQVEQMAQYMQHRAKDGVEFYSHGSIGMAHLKLWTTPESVNEIQPLPDETQTLWVTLHGRIDNYRELMDVLAAKDFHVRSKTDAEIVLRAYQCWGIDCPQHIIGDFAFVIWDSQHKRVFCARDILGVKPFFYFVDSSQFLWASEIRPIIEAPGVPAVPNEYMVAEFLAKRLRSRDQTLYSQVFRLKPAHALIVSETEVREFRYWDVDLSKTLFYRREEEYVEHFLELFETAVRDRLRHYGRIGVLLSGGVDSRSVAAMIRDLATSGYTDTLFETFSLVHPNKPEDETPAIRDIAKTWNITSHFFESETPTEAFIRKQLELYKDFPGYPHGLAYETLRTQASQDNFRTLFSGFGGDDWHMGFLFRYEDILAQGRVLTLLRQYFSDAQQADHSYAGNKLISGLKTVTIGKLPPRVIKILRRLRTWNGTVRPWPWLTEEFVYRGIIQESNNSDYVDKSFASYTQKGFYNWLVSATLVFFLELQERMTARHGIEERYPLHDRRIIEFSMAMKPNYHWLHPYKHLLIESLKRLSPETSSIDFRDPEASATLINTIESCGGLFRYSHLFTENRGWIIPSEVVRLYEKTMSAYRDHNPEYATTTALLWNIMAIDLWYETAFS